MGALERQTVLAMRRAQPILSRAHVGPQKMPTPHPRRRTPPLWHMAIWSVVIATLQASRRSAFVLGAGVGGKACAPESQGGNNRRNFCLSEIPAGNDCVMKVMLPKNSNPNNTWMPVWREKTWVGVPLLAKGSPISNQGLTKGSWESHALPISMCCAWPQNKLGSGGKI